LEEKFIHDIKVQLKTIHPHIVKLYGFFDDEIYFYMVFEYMESGNLVKTIEEMGGKLP
jgi:serine/threonine protein kinase